MEIRASGGGRCAVSESHSLSGTRRMQSMMNLSAQPESCTWRSAIALAVHAQSPPADLALVEHPPLALALAEDTYRQAAKAACCFTCGAQESGLMRGARVKAQRRRASVVARSVARGRRVVRVAGVRRCCCTPLPSGGPRGLLQSLSCVAGSLSGITRTRRASSTRLLACPDP